MSTLYFSAYLRRFLCKMVSLSVNSGFMLITVMTIYHIDGGGDGTVCIIFMLVHYAQCLWVVRVSVIGW